MIHDREQVNRDFQRMVCELHAFCQRYNLEPPTLLMGDHHREFIINYITDRDFPHAPPVQRSMQYFGVPFRFGRIEKGEVIV